MKNLIGIITAALLISILAVDSSCGNTTIAQSSKDSPAPPNFTGITSPTFPSTPFDPINPGKVPENKAIEIASKFVPQDALDGAMITTSVGIDNGQITWAVIYTNTTISLTRKQLKKTGWQEDKNTVFNTAFSPDGTFNQLMIVIDANTGVIVSKEAMKAIHLDGPTSTTVK